MAQDGSLLATRPNTFGDTRPNDSIVLLLRKPLSCSRLTCWLASTTRNASIAWSTTSQSAETSLPKRKCSGPLACMIALYLRSNSSTHERTR